MPHSSDNRLGAYLRDRRSKLDPAAMGFSLARRRTPGLRREEVAQRANVSPTWYTWLEQGRGGAPSADVLDRIARALVLTDVEREHLFLLGLGRQPDVRYRTAPGVTPRLQRVLDALELSPAYVKTSTWDIVAWNRAASVIMGDFDALPVEQRNGLRRIFTNPELREVWPNWESDARFALSVFRVDIASAGAEKNVEALIDELSQKSPDFVAMWRENDVPSTFGEGLTFERPSPAGILSLEYSTFAVEGRSDLRMVIYNPATPVDAERIRSLLTLERRDRAQIAPS
jgi:transcriptional regulator with XRE-family HTH domain